MEERRQGQKFTLDYLGKYYFYEEDEFKKLRTDAEEIIKKIQEYSRYQEGDHAFTRSKFGNITESFTQKQVEIILPDEGDTVLIGGEKRHLDLAYKMEIKELEDHMRIGTRLIEEGKSISCLMYIDYNQSKSFVESLNQFKDR